MEFLIRLLLYAATGLMLVVANLWFIRLIYKDFLSSEYVIVPFNVIDPSGSAAAEKTGLALAQMMAARLSNIQAQLKATQEAVKRQPSGNDRGSTPSVAILFVPRAVIIPTNLFEPVNIKATVGGVEVGGIISSVQRMLSHKRAIAFTTYERTDKVIISADLGNLTPGARLWFESGKHPDDVATNAAYALLQLSLAEKQPSQIQALELADFRNLLETIFSVDALNRRVAQGHNVESQFVKLLPTIETQLEKAPKWPELFYLAGSIAEGAHNIGKAVLYYRKVQDLNVADKSKVDARLSELAITRLTALGAKGIQVESEVQARFVQESREFAHKMALAGPDPEIAFVPQEVSAVQVLWNEKTKRMEVNPINLAAPGLAQYVALMGRFFARNYDRCLGPGAPTNTDGFAFWNEFRSSVVDYLIQTQPGYKEFRVLGMDQKFFAALKEIARKLASKTPRA